MENSTTERKIRIFFYCVKKTLLVNYFHKYTFKVPASSHFFGKSRKVRNTAQSTKMAHGIYPKLYIFNGPVQKEGNFRVTQFNSLAVLPKRVLEFSKPALSNAQLTSKLTETQLLDCFFNSY